jgi:hypothetical protein
VIVRPVGQQHNCVYGYIRASLADAKSKDLSVERQRRLITAFSQSKYEKSVDEFFIDTECIGSTKILDREGARTLTDVMEEHDVVIATRFDRLSMSVPELLELIPHFQETGVHLYFCEQFGDMPIAHRSPHRYVEGMEHHVDMDSRIHSIFTMALQAVHQLNAAVKRDKCEHRKVELMRQGFWSGGPIVPYGFRLKPVEHEGKIRQWLEPVPEEQKWIEVILKMRERKMGYSKIAREINSLQNERVFSHAQIRKIIDKPERYTVQSLQKFV